MTPGRRELATRLLFAVDAVLGIISIGGAALYGAAWSSGNAWTTAFAIFIPGATLWASFCYGAYRGLGSDNPVLKVVFWAFVVVNLVPFPVGTAISATCIWLWRTSRGVPASSAGA